MRIVFSGFVVALSVGRCLAQLPDPSAIVTAVQELHGGVVEASFVHRVSSDLWSDDQVFSGELVLHGEAYRIQTEHELVVGRGSEARIYRVAENQVLITNLEPDEAAFSPGHLLSSLDEDYSPRSLEQTLYRDRPHYQLVLDPIDSGSYVQTLSLWIRTRDLAVTRVRANDRSGSVTELALDDIVIGRPLDPGTFEFTPPAGTEVIDLR